MRISLESLDGRHFTLELPLDHDAARAHRLAIHQAANLRGVYRQEPTLFALEGVRVDELAGDVLWQLAAGSLHLGGPLSASAVLADLVIGRGQHGPPTGGLLQAAALQIPALEVKVGTTEVRGRLSTRTLRASNPASPNRWELTLEELEGARLALQQGALRLELEQLTAAPLQGAYAEGAWSVQTTQLVLAGLLVQREALNVQIARIQAQGVRVNQRAQGLQLEVDQLQLHGVQFELGTDSKQRARCLGNLTLRGLRWRDDALTLEELTCDDIEFDVALPQGTAKAPASAAPPSTARPAPARAQATTKPSLELLDQLQGQLIADLKLDIKLPVISRRVATHKLRLGVERGTISYKELEGGLSFLEDALLDFAVRRGALVLELKGLKKPLVQWPLDAEELQLAQRGRVKLQVLAAPAPATGRSEPPVVAAREPAPRESSVGLTQIDATGIDVRLGLGGGSAFTLAPKLALRLGWPNVPAIEELVVQGNWSYAPQAPSQLAQPLHLGLRGLTLGLDRLELGSRNLHFDGVTLRELHECTLWMHGVQPTAVRGTLRGLGATGLALTP